MLRHERQTVAMALAEYHSAQRQKTARAGAWVRPQEHGTQHFFLDDDSVLELGGSRPDRLADLRPQERVQRRTVEQIVDSMPVVPLLHTAVPQMVDSVVEMLKILDNSLPDVEQVIEVPTISLHKVPQLSSLLEPQVAEQLVDVPVPESVILARGRDAAGITWCQVAGHQGTRRWVYWWMTGTRHVQWTPQGFTASSGR